MQNKVYFGTKERMIWVKPPATGVNLGAVGWNSNGVDLNGMAYNRNSPSASRSFEFSWGASLAEDIYAITDYRTGAYGLGRIYYLDPFAMRTNLLPSNFSMPWVLAEQGKAGASGVAGAMSTTVVASPARNMPFARSLTNFSSPVLAIPVPAGYRLHVAYAASGVALKSSTNNSTWANVNPTAVASATWTPTVYTSSMMYFKWENTTAVNVLGAIAVLLPTAETMSTTTPWVSGNGNWGLEFVGEPELSGISAAIGNNGGYISGSVSLLETGINKQP